MGAGRTTEPQYADRLDHLAALLGAAWSAADPAAAVRGMLRLDQQALWVGHRRLSLTPDSRLYLVALGKAAVPMASAAAECLGQRLTAGVATELAPSGGVLPASVDVIRAGHPLPDEGSLRAGRAMLDLASRASRGDVFIVLISGGGSAMAEALRPGVELDEVRGLTGRLLHAGAPIQAINAVRRELSQLKGGGLARRASPAQVIGLLFSDVVGDDPASVASGPTVIEPWAPRSGRRALHRLGLWSTAPPSIREALSQAPDPARADPAPLNQILARNADMLAAAGAEARRLGFAVHALKEPMQGEASAVGARLGRRLRSAGRPACLLAGGETTVTIRRGGRGGRNQEVALAAALELHRLDRVLLAAWASDGIDGPTDAAGAWIDGSTLDRARTAGLDPRTALEAHDAYPLLDQLGALLLTGPTGTNLNDLVVGLTYAA